MPSSLNRRQTCPITRQESEQLMDFFLNIAQPSTSKKHIERQTPNSNIHSGQHGNSPLRMSPRPVFQRSDSYRKATQKFLPDETNNNEETLKPFKKENYDRKKYMSLPIETKSRVKPKDNLTPVDRSRNKLNRQKSGTVPSSDSDHPTSPTENRKKKSVFQRTKERFIFRLWKEKKKSGSYNETSKENKNDKSMLQRSSNQPTVRDPTVESDSRRGQKTEASHYRENIEPSEHDITSRNYHSFQEEKEEIHSPSDDMAPAKSSDRGRRFRTQVSREEITNMFEKILSSAEVSEEPFKFPKHTSSKPTFQRKDVSPVKDLSYADGIKSKKCNLTLNIVPFTPGISINDQVQVTRERNETVVDVNGVQHRIHRRTTTTYERTTSIEIDGGDEVDGPTKKSPHKSPTKENKEPLSPTEQEKMIEEVARRLNKIADDCLQRMGTGESQTAGAVATPLLSPNSRSRKLTNDLLIELRKEGDRLSQELDLPDSLLPIVMDLVKQITYDHFKSVVKKALCETIGWDQLAMYFYVSRAAIVMAGAGGQKLKDIAVKYFHEELCPWVQDKGGLETMLEETDSEVD